MPPVAPHRLLHILLVEDSPSDRLLALEAFARTPLANCVHAVDTGADALAYLRREGRFTAVRQPDLVLLDLNMPKHDGRELLTEIKADPRLSTIPSIVLTTSQDDADVRFAYAHHAVSFICKPVEFERFVHAVDVLGTYWSEVVTLPPSPDASASRPRPPEPPRQLRGTRRHDRAVRLLLVEDDPVDVMLLRAALEPSPGSRFALHYARRLAEIPAILAAHDIDIVLTDLGLPDSVGLDTYRHVQRLAPSLPVIVLTGLDDDAVGQAALGEGAQDYLVKGQITGPALARAVRHAIERNQLMARLRYAQRTEALGQLAGGIAHEFNNLLTVIQGNASLLGSTQERGQIAALAADIEDATTRAAGLVRQLLTFSGQQVMRPAAVDLGVVVDDFVRMIRRLIPGTVRIAMRAAPELPAVVADVGMLEQAIFNLTLNARDAMPGGGLLEFETSLVEVAAEVAAAHGAPALGRYVRLSVHDTGVGVPEELATVIWEPFFTTKELGAGTGLGLATVRAIAQQHQGWAELRAPGGPGATFDLYLPASQLPVETERRRPRRVALSLVPDLATILIVDSDDAARRTSAEVVAEAGHSVLTASSAVEALAAVGEALDLLLVDMTTPGVAQLVLDLSARFPALELVFTGPERPPAGAPPLGMRWDFIPKPAAPELLLATIGARLGARRS